MPNIENKNVISSSKERVEQQFEEIKNKERALNSKSIINENKTKEIRATLMKEFFKTMEDAGVDPNNLQSINQFLQALEKQDPDLKELYEFFFSRLVEEQGEEIPQEGLPALPPQRGLPAKTPNLMDKFNNLGEETLMPR